jgi:hypothetical protein
MEQICHRKKCPVAERCRVRVYGRSLAGIAGSNSAGCMDGRPLCVVR